MNAIVIVVLLLVIISLVVFAVWQFLQTALVHIDSGTVGLLIVRGKATGRTLTPGTHFVMPFRQQSIQGYPLRDLTYLTTDQTVEDSDYADPPLEATLGDRAGVLVQYTIRFRIRPEGLLEIHERLGPQGIKPFVRDVSRQIIIDDLADESRTVDDAFGTPFAELEKALGARIEDALQQHGFEPIMFHLRTVDVGALEDVVSRTVRARLELDLERALAEVRDLRIENEGASNERLAGVTDEVLRYRQIELLREALQRWDGKLVVDDHTTRMFGAAPATADGAPARVPTDVAAIVEEQA